MQSRLSFTATKRRYQQAPVRHSKKPYSAFSAEPKGLTSWTLLKTNVAFLQNCMLRLLAQLSGKGANVPCYAPNLHRYWLGDRLGVFDCFEIYEKTSKNL
jgi:hypothetical protein